MKTNFVKIRLTGLPQDVAETAKIVRKTGVQIVEESEDYPNVRSDFVRRYLMILPEVNSEENES